MKTDKKQEYNSRIEKIIYQELINGTSIDELIENMEMLIMSLKKAKTQRD
jgi:hypothetical protein